MADKQLNRWVLGIDMIADDSDMPEGTLKEALNVDISKDGVTRSAPIPRLVVDGEIDSIHGGSYTLCASKGSVYHLNVEAGIKTLIFTMNSDDRVSFCDMLDGIVIMNRTTLAFFKEGVVTPLGIDKPAQPAVTESSAGGLNAGKYGVAISLISDSGEESPLSDVAFIEISQGSGMQITLPSTDQPFIKIYRTEPNGENLYESDKIPAMSQYLLGARALGRISDTQYLSKMISGRIARQFKGRLLVAKSNILYFSEPLRYGVYSPRHGFVQFSHRIVMIEPVDGGVYVGTRKGVFFLAGTNPKEWVVKDTGGKPPIQYASCGMSTGELSPEVTANVGNGQGAVWLSENGFVVGLPSGSLIELQRTRITGLSGEAGSLAVFNRRVRATTGG